MDSIIEVIVSRCLGCHTCELECALAHSKSDTFTEAMYSGERLYPRIILEVDGKDVVPMHCRHCTEAPCITVCPTAAMSRQGPEDPVILNPDKCIGCNSCVMVCPFGVIKAAEDRALSKCDLCAARLQKGEIPACAASCPTKAIRFTSISGLSKDRRREVVRKYRVSLEQDESTVPDPSGEK